MILYLPLDERPCNLNYPQMIAQLQPQRPLITPPPNLLGQKKQPAQVDAIATWLVEQCAQAQIAIVSVEMLVYGGLLPSRLHQDSTATLLVRLDVLKQLKTQQPHLKIFASNLIMRTPRYNSSEEEPDYYADWGEAIFTWGWLTDQTQREGLSTAEQKQLDHLTATIPSTDLADYRDRRAKNLQVNQGAIALVKAGTIDFLAIPQDDCARYGFTALDQRVIYQQIRRDRLQTQIHVYPGADEVGCTLLARAHNTLTQRQPNVYVLYSAVGSEQIVPLYEDRPLGESLKAHILAAGAQRVTTPEAADFVLAVNTAGQVMEEAWDQETKNITYDSYRSLRCFVSQIAQYLSQGQQVAIADVAFANGGETELIQLLDDSHCLENLLAYGGWNTSCNTIGSVLATAILGSHHPSPHAIAHNLVYHLLEDWLYQAIVRQDVIKNDLPQIGASYYEFQGQDRAIAQAISQRLHREFRDRLHHSFTTQKLRYLEVTTPWQRMFEIGLSVSSSSLSV